MKNIERLRQLSPHDVAEFLCYQMYCNECPVQDRKSCNEESAWKRWLEKEYDPEDKTWNV